MLPATVPSSILGSLSKLVERLVFSQLPAYLNGAQLLTPRQAAHCERYNSKVTTFKMAFDASDSANAGGVTILALLDLSAAFDSIGHDVLP